MLEAYPNWENATPEQLRVAMEAAPNKRSYIRLAAVRALMLGQEPSTVCELYDRTDLMVRLWIELFNRGGIDAVITRPKPGRPRKVKLERVRDLLLPVLADPAKAGRVHWTGVKLQGYLKEQLALELGYRTTIRWPYQLDCRRCPRRVQQRKRVAPPLLPVREQSAELEFHEAANQIGEMASGHDHLTSNVGL